MQIVYIFLLVPSFLTRVTDWASWLCVSF